MTPHHPKFKAAAVQAAPEFLDLESGIQKAIRIIADSAARGVRLVAFPETWLPGYPWWAWLGSPAWGMRFLQQYVDNSLQLESSEMKLLQDAARKHDIFVSMGFSERAGGSLFIAQVLIGPSGELIATRRKLKPTHVERTIFGEGAGIDLRVDATELGNIGQLCCWEHLQPLNRYALFAQNEQVHVGCWPSFSLYSELAYALGPEVNLAASMTYAAEGQCFAIAPCGVVSDDLLRTLGPEHEGLLSVGGGYAAIFGPDGRRLTEALPPQDEGLVIAEIDLSLIILAKSAADPGGHYARPDATQLILHDEPRPPLVRVSQSRRSPGLLERTEAKSGEDTGEDAGG